MGAVKRIFRRDSRSGNTLVLVTVFSVALFGFAALSIDVARVYYEVRRMQIATDAGAYAGVWDLLTSQAAAIATAKAVAQANGIATNEFSASALRGVQVGTWNSTTKTFTPNGTPANAVRVSAKRVVPLYFGPVVGARSMAPDIHSVAIINSRLVPFGTSAVALGTNGVGSTLVASSTDPGNWGKLNFGDVLRNPNDWVEAFTYGYSGTIGPQTVVNGQTVFDVATDPGFAHLTEAWNARKAIDPIVVLPVILGTFPNGQGNVFIYQFITARLLDQTAQGRNWQGNLQILGISGDLSQAYTRFLVE